MFEKGLKQEPGSFRDRKSRVFYRGDRIYRALNLSALEHWEALSRTRFFQNATADGRLIATMRVDTAEKFVVPDFEGCSALLEHEKIPYVSYPYEWSFGMLKEAAILQLKLLLAALDEGMILKDSSPFNIQWIGARPVFIDIPSFEKAADGEPWTGYNQFSKMFLYPLFLQAYKDVPFHAWLRGRLHGIESEEMENLMSVRDLLRPGVFTRVYLHSRLQRRYAGSRENLKENLKASGFTTEMIRINATRLLSLVHRLEWKRARSTWLDYDKIHGYSDEELEKKTAFVRKVVHSRPWGLVWDLGCNTGLFSRIAAENAAYVVAMDADHLAIERLYKCLKSEHDTRILPLVVDLADPSPNLGWRGLERKSHPERGKPELTLCLALIHHVAISANIPVRDFIGWLQQLGTALVIEFVTRDDEMVHQLLRHREDIYADYTSEYFEQCLGEAFEIADRDTLKAGKRMIYYAKPRS